MLFGAGSGEAISDGAVLRRSNAHYGSVSLTATASEADDVKSFTCSASFSLTWPKLLVLGQSSIKSEASVSCIVYPKHTTSVFPATSKSSEKANHHEQSSVL